MHSLPIANYFILKSLATGVELTPQKLVKMVYVAHGWYLALTGKPLLAEGIQAWKYGPIITSVYNKFIQYGNSQIDELYFNAAANTYPIVEEKSLKEFLDKIWEVYNTFNGPELSTITHETNTPWDIIWNAQGKRKREGIIIPNDLIEKYYKERANGETAKQSA